MAIPLFHVMVLDLRAVATILGVHIGVEMPELWYDIGHDVHVVPDGAKG